METQSLEGVAAASAEVFDQSGCIPLLSIGLAVYNGERHLRQAIDSLLAQDVTDLELIISDNASTDATPQVCAEYARRDARVRYTRNQSNIGAAANFNRVFELSSGQYFMWGSDDDVWEPSFGRRCIEALEANPRAVLCASLVRLIGEDGRVLQDTYEAGNTEGLDVTARIHDLIRRSPWYDMYSVIRPSALRRTGLYAPTYGGDVHLLLELSLLGEFILVPEVLFTYRRPERRKTNQQFVAEICADGASDEQVVESAGFLIRDLLSVVRASGLDSETISRISEDFVETLSQPESPIGREILQERGLPPMTAEVAQYVIRKSLAGRQTSPANEMVERARTTWAVREGMRLRGLRRAALRLLRPFTDRQTALEIEYAVALEMLAEENRRLSERIEALEGRDETEQNADA